LLKATDHYAESQGENMPDLSILTGFLACSTILAGGIAFHVMRKNAAQAECMRQAEAETATLEESNRYLREQLEEMNEARASQLKAAEERSAAMAEKNEALKDVEVLKGELDVARQQREEAMEARAAAERKADLTQQRMQDMELRMKDWETQRAEAQKAASEAILKAGGDMSNKLLEDHKREMEEAKKQSEAMTKQTTEKLFEQFTSVTNMVSALKEQSIQNRDQMDTVMRALTNPGGAGRMAEVGLENSLKNLGLEPGRDFIMQYHIKGGEGHGLRPDAVVFLPQNMVIVVDSKASKHLIELAEAEEEGREQVMTKLAKSMNEHLKALCSKNYRNAIEHSYKESGRQETIGHVLNVMYLPTESAIETLSRADAEFNQKCEKSGIILVGPSTLAGLFSLARSHIAAARQAENEQRIIETVSELMSSISVAFKHVDKVGNGLKSATKSYNDLAGSVNKYMISRMKKLEALGVSPAKQKEIPQPLSRYDVHQIDHTLDVEAEEESPANKEQPKLSLLEASEV
jgi:DNA recombination protein RmuC